MPTTRLLLTIGALTVGGCASSQAARESETAPPTAEQRGMRGGMMQQDMAGMCPMQVEGTSVMAEEVEGGVGLAFTTTGDVAELRRRVAHMAEMHNRRGGAEHERGMGMHGHQGSADQGHAQAGPSVQRDEARGGGMHGEMMGGPMMPAANAMPENIESGARIVLTPRDRGELTALREHVRHLTDRMASGQCPMMSTRDGQGGEAASEPTDQESHRPEGGG